MPYLEQYPGECGKHWRGPIHHIGTNFKAFLYELGRNLCSSETLVMHETTKVKGTMEKLKLLTDVTELLSKLKVFTY